MSDSQKLIRKQIMITEAQNDFVVNEARARDPREYAAPGGTRAQNGVFRDLIDFGKAHQEAFRQWVAGR